MNIVQREWQFYRKQTMYWGLGLLFLILIALYKVSSMNSMQGGMEEMLKSLPPLFQAFFGAGGVDYTTGVGSYSMIHLYVVIALALHAAILGANIFAKEELDKTYEFLYVKGVKRWRILVSKVFAGTTILISLILLCFISIAVSVVVMGLSLNVADLMPYLVSLFLTQIFFFSFGLACSLLLRNSQRAGMIGSCTVLVMFLISMYVKIGGSVGGIENLSLFHYSDASYITANGFGGMSSILIFIISVAFIACSMFVHDRRDLL